MDERTLLDMDYEGLSDADATAILLIGAGDHAGKTRLMKMVLLYIEAMSQGRDPLPADRYSQGYCDEVEESANNLRDMGILREDQNGYALTDYGGKLRTIIAYKEPDRADRSTRLVSSLSGIPDRGLTAIAAVLYPDRGSDPRTLRSVEGFAARALLDGRPVGKWTAEEFEGRVRLGEPMAFDGPERHSKKQSGKEEEVSR